MDEYQFRPVKALLGFWVVWRLLFLTLIGGVVLTVISTENGEVAWGAAIPIFLAIVLMALVHTILYFFSVRYQLGDRYITTAAGVWWKQRRSVPLEKITNLDVRQGPIERALRYGSIWIFTPSTGGDIPEEKLVGIINPHEMKQKIIERSEASKKNATLGAIDGSTQGTQHSQVIDLLTEIRDTLQRIENSSIK